MVDQRGRIVQKAMAVRFTAKNLTTVGGIGGLFHKFAKRLKVEETLTAQVELPRRELGVFILGVFRGSISVSARGNPDLHRLVTTSNGDNCRRDFTSPHFRLPSRSYDDSRGTL